MSDLESKDEGSNLEKPLTQEDVQPTKATEEETNVGKEEVGLIDMIDKEDENRMSKSTIEGVDNVDGTTESEATMRMLRTSDADFDASHPVFVNPDEGTPAAEALAGTAPFLPLQSESQNRLNLPQYQYFQIVLSSFPVFFISQRMRP